MRYKLFLIIAFIIAFSSSVSLLAQCFDPGDPDDPGNRDTLWIERENIKCYPDSQIIIHVIAFWDEWLAAASIPLKYKNPQTDIFLDSAKLTAFTGMTADTIIDRSAGTILYFFLGLTGGTIPPGRDTFFTLYFTLGPTWDPSVQNLIDTFNPGQGLSFVDTAINDIQPIFCNLPGVCQSVRDDNRFPSVLRPTNFTLSQNFPNPFNTETIITFALPRSSYVKIEIFNILGQKVRDLVDEEVSAGYKQVVWDGRDNAGEPVASGVYLYQLNAGGFKEAKRMILLK